ncbi:MAG TPA: diaminopimelate epimerase [Flavitalea sp.]|nr:diaminopimelate epimerase [Flavitalea sp.]
MEVSFHKYQGTGNDFIIMDNRDLRYKTLTAEKVKKLCDRRFGIGADGLMFLQEKEGYDFEMIYFNSDGKPASMCGNGGRCLVKFARSLGIDRVVYKFMASDGDHEGEIDDEIISIKMRDVDDIREYHGDFILNTGSPHYVKIINNLKDFDVFRKGREIRNSNNFQKDGINVNFVEQISEDEIYVRTYERGVEDETLSCGTGITAAAIICYHNDNGYNDVTVQTRGGKLTVEYDRRGDDRYENIWLCGPAEKVFEGTTTIN